MATITYEQPLNERIRTLLRLEELLHRFGYLVSGEHRWESHGALTTLLEIVELAGRGDLKSELMKELERQIANLERLADQPHVDQSQLQQIIDRQRDMVDRLSAMPGQPDQHLRSNEFLNGIKKRTAIPGGTCAFDLPSYHYWLARPPRERFQQLKEWVQPFELVQEATDLILMLIRESAAPARKTAERGFYQQSLDPETPYQMVRVQTADDAPWYPEISAGKHRFAIRFMTYQDPAERPVQSEEDLPFDLTCCAW